MTQRESAPAMTGLVIGVLVALGFALLIGLLPESLFLQAHWRVGVYVVCAGAAPPSSFQRRGRASPRAAMENCAENACQTPDFC